MLRPRIIPCLLVHKAAWSRRCGFKDPKYVGDPINAVKIFNEKEADELIVLDIDATAQRRRARLQADRAASPPSAACRCATAAASRTVEQAKRIIGLGVEKVAISCGRARRTRR